LGIAVLVSYVMFNKFSEEIIVATLAVATGAILVMLAKTRILRAFESTHDFPDLLP